MPQCSKCGKEIREYGICDNCKKLLASVKREDTSTCVKRTPCPKCGSLYVKLRNGKHLCTMCGETFD